MRRVLAGLAGLATAAALAIAPAAPSTAAPAPLTNLAHLDFLLQRIALHPVSGHSTEGSAPVELPWAYATREADGSFERVGGGTYDAAANTYGQGAFDADDVSRAAVVYLRDWRQTGAAAARAHAEAVLRGLAYFQTTTGAHAGEVVLWMQPDGSLNPTPTPPDTPNPSDAGASYWLARTIWAYGEGVAAFRSADPRFAAFLQARMDLAVRALDRDVLGAAGRTVLADGVRVPAWLIVNDAGASAEAVLGLAADVRAAPRDRAVRSSLVELSSGIRQLADTTSAHPDGGPRCPEAPRAGTACGGGSRGWPYGAILPAASSRTSWHAWASQMSASLVAAAGALHEASLLRDALRDTAAFEPALLASGGAVDLWGPTPSDRTEIAYGIDSRVENLLAVADATHAAGLDRLAALQASWFFGANGAGVPTYDPATGATDDGVAPDGTVNRNSGAESTIHGLLTMLALDAHPAVAAEARALTALGTRHGLTVVEAESAKTDGTVFTPDPASNAELTWSGKGLELRAGQHATFALGSGDHVVEAVIQNVEAGTATTPISRWTGAGVDRTIRSTVGAQGITAVPGALLPQTIGEVHGGALTVSARAGTVRIDALLVRPPVSAVTIGSGSSAETLAVASIPGAATAAFAPGTRVALYRSDGSSAGVVRAGRTGRASLPAGGFAIGG